MKTYSLGIDTSNYTTSVAVTDKDANVIFDRRIMLSVKEGERGLRQQEALFQHINNLPELIKDVINDETREKVGIIAVSNRPRPVSSSYMPCFKAGQSAGKAVSAALGVPYVEFSHQEGHIAAVDNIDDDEFLSYHLSGGTCELLRVKRQDPFPGGISYDIDIIGGSLDISAGQLLDRTGVAMGYSFPAGKSLDKIAINKAKETAKDNTRSHAEKNIMGTGRSGRKDLLTGVKIQDLWFNLSGLETQVLKTLKSSDDESEKEELIYELFCRISTLLIKETKAARKKTGVNKIIFAGGVSKSSFIRNALSASLDEIVFGEYSEDNAVGTSLLGGRYLWHSNPQR